MIEVKFAAAHHARALVFVAALHDTVEQWIDGPDGHHLQRVRRLEVDEELIIADGSGRWYPARITETRAGGVGTERIGADHTEPQLRPALTIAFAPAKRDHGSEVVRQLVELGVDCIIPLACERSVVRWDGERGVKALARLRRVVREAAMQCHRARVPMVEPPTSIQSLGTEPGLLLGDPEGLAIDTISDPPDDRWVAVIGPEGGLTPGELAELASATKVRVGPYVLRSVTAPGALAAALAVRRRA